MGSGDANHPVKVYFIMLILQDYAARTHSTNAIAKTLRFYHFSFPWNGKKIASFFVALFSALNLIFTTINIPAESFEQSNLVDRPKRELLATIHIDTVSPDNRELAEQLEIWPMLLELYNKEAPASRERRILLRQKIRETIFECFFDAVSVEAEALREQDLLEAQRESLINKRDRNIELNNATNFIAAGTLNTIGSALGFTNSIPPFPGNFNQMLSGVVAATMSTYSLHQANGAKVRGQGHPTLIAELFGRPYDERTAYPESVWRFLHGRSPEDPSKTRVQILEDRWISRHHLEKHGSRREVLKLDLLCGLPIPKKCMTIDDLNDQISIIGDIDANAALMNHHLRDLLALIDSDILEFQSPKENKE